MTSIRLFNSRTLPGKYSKQILNSNLCMRDGEDVVHRDWVKLQLSRATFVIVALVSCNVKGFLLGFDFDKESKKKKIWTLDTICREPGEQNRLLVGLLIARFVKEAKKNDITQIVLYATTKYSKVAYLKYGFITMGREDKTGGTHMRLDI